MTAGKECPTCGGALSADAVEGLCPKCLGRLAFSALGAGGETSELRRLGDYELLEEIARGGMGVVYRARQLSLNRIVGVKVMLSGPFSGADSVRRFQNEAEAAAALRHPNIVTIYEVGERDGTHFLAMEFVEGRNFSELVRDQPLPARRAAGYLRTIALAMQHAHECGVLHRDLKPSNILLDVFDQPRVTDFGLAKFLDRGAEATVPGSVLGSPNFIPPEQAAGKFSEIAAPADVYSLGAILYHLLTGRPPFQGEGLHEILEQVQTSEPVPPRKLNPSVPRDLQTICLKCLQKEPARRYATARALAEDLELFLAGKAIRARPVSPAEAVWLWCRRRPALAGLIVAFHLALAGGLAGILYEWQRANLHARGETRLRLVSETNAETTRLNLYAADVALAAQVIQQGDFGRARRTLARLRPQPGETDLRGFEWRYLWSRCQGGQLATLGQHEWIVTCVSFSPDGKTMASGGMGGEVKIWDAEKLACLQTLRVSTGAVWSVAFTPDGGELMIACTSGVLFRDLASGRVRTNFPGRIAALSGDGALLAVSASAPFFWEETGAVTLWNRVTGERLRTLAEPGRALALSRDGKTLAVAAETNGVRLYETAAGKLLRILPTKKPVWSLHFSADGLELLSAGWSGEVCLWKTADDAAPKIFAANNLNVWDADFSPDGKSIITTSSDQTIRFWNRATLDPEYALRGHESEVWCAAFSPDGKKMITGGKDRNVMLWTIASPAPEIEIANDNGVLPLFSPDGTKLVTVNPDPEGAYALWLLPGRSLAAKNLARRHVVVGFSRDRDHVIAFAEGQRALEFWPPLGDSPARNVPLNGLPARTGEFEFWGMSPEQEFFFALDRAGIARIWNPETGALQTSFAVAAPPIRNAVLSPHGKFLAVSTERENPVSLIDCATGKTLQLKGHHDFTSGLAFSPDGSLLATGSMDGTIRLWRTSDGAAAGLLPGHLEETTDVAFSPDGRTLASVGEEESLKLWHVPTLREVLFLSLPHAGHHLQFSPDGKRLAVNTDGNKLLILEAP
jgi:WD40 repeat protein/predicted Ser/Thr protein kinase